MRRRQFIQTLFSGLAAFGAWPAAARAESGSRFLIQESPVAGFQYHEGAEVWPYLRVGDALDLVREGRNSFDARAVSIEWSGRKLGYVPRVDNAAISQMLDRDVPLIARIERLRDDPDPWQRVQFSVAMLFW